MYDVSTLHRNGVYDHTIFISYAFEYLATYYVITVCYTVLSLKKIFLNLFLNHCNNQKKKEVLIEVEIVSPSF